MASDSLNPLQNLQQNNSANPQPSPSTSLLLLLPEPFPGNEATDSINQDATSPSLLTGASTPELQRQSTNSANVSPTVLINIALRRLSTDVEPPPQSATPIHLSANNTHPASIEEAEDQNSSRPSAPTHQEDATTTPPKWEEWRSWKIGLLWLSGLLFITLSIIAIIAILEVVSRRNSGFVTLSSPPAFLTHDPAFEQAIWSQGIVYTAFPAFLMTIYRTMWESSVTAFADRQPYVDLKKEGGATPQSTIMIDYKAKPFVFSWFVALRNRHILLSMCMLSSLVLAVLVVPLTSFVFTTAPFVSNTTFPLYFDTAFNTSILEDFPNVPDLRLSLDSAAAMRLQDARSPPWTDGEYAFASFVPLTEVSDGNIELLTTAYSVQSNCVFIPESQYQKIYLPPDQTGIPALVILIKANDRGCLISSNINIRFSNNLENNIQVWATTSCSADAGWSRYSILTAAYKDASTGATNFSLISCQPSYQITTGTLSAMSDSSSAPSLAPRGFAASNTTQVRPDAVWRFFGMQIQSPGCVDPERIVESNNEFGRYIYSISSTKNTSSPLAWESIRDAAELLFSTTFAVFASTVLFQPASTPANGSGIYSTQETRVIVVSPVAYIILSVLAVIALLIVALCFHARQESMLFEEPVGLLSNAAILFRSAVNEKVADHVAQPDFRGKITEAMKSDVEFMKQKFRFDDDLKSIVVVRPATTPQV